MVTVVMSSEQCWSGIQPSKLTFPGESGQSDWYDPPQRFVRQHCVSETVMALWECQFMRLERLSAACQRNQVWLVVDNTYEHFTYEEAWFWALIIAWKCHSGNKFELMHLKTWMFAFAVYHSQTVHATIFWWFGAGRTCSPLFHQWRSRGECLFLQQGQSDNVWWKLVASILGFPLQTWGIWNDGLANRPGVGSKCSLFLQVKTKQWHVVWKKVTTRGMIVVTYNLHLYVCLHGILEAIWTGPQCS